MLMDYAPNTHQELIMVQLDLEKASDHVMDTMDFRFWVNPYNGLSTSYVSPHIFIRTRCGARVMLKAGVTSDIALTRSVRQG